MVWEEAGVTLEMSSPSQKLEDGQMQATKGFLQI